MINLQLFQFLCDPMILLPLVLLLQRVMNELHAVRSGFSSDKHPNILILTQNLSKIS